MIKLLEKQTLITTAASILMTFGIGIPQAWAQTTELTLKQSIELALENNRSLKADSLTIAETQYKNRELAGTFLPQANVSTGAECNIAIPSQLLPGSIVAQPEKELVPVKFGTRYSVRPALEVNQVLFRKDLSIKMGAAGLYTEIAATKYQLSKEELVYQVAAAFHGLLASHEMVENTLHDYLNIKGVLDVAKAQYDHGTLKKIDYQTLEINLANKESQLNQQQTQYNEQLTRFNYLVGLPPTVKTILKDDPDKAGRLLIPENEVAQRTDLRLYQQLIQSKIVDLKSTRAEGLPTVNTYFRYSLQSQFNNASDAFDGDYRFKASSIGISISTPVFDGNRRKNRMRATQVQLTQLALESRQLQDQTEMELVQASETFNNNRKQLTITKENLWLAGEVFDSRKALYGEGVSTLIELLDAERELSQARTNYKQAVINVQQGLLDIHKANGTLLTKYLAAL